jgi:hypothetical protein
MIMAKVTPASQETVIPAELQQNRYYDIDQEEEGSEGHGTERGGGRRWGSRLITTLRDHPFLGALLLLQGGLIIWLAGRPAPAPPVITKTVRAKSPQEVEPPAYPHRPDPFAALPGMAADAEGRPAEPPGLVEARTMPRVPAPVAGVPALAGNGTIVPDYKPPPPPKPAGPTGPDHKPPSLPVTLRGIALYGEQRLAVLAAGPDLLFKREGDALGDGSWKIVRIARDQVVAEAKTGERVTLRLE